MGLKRILAIGAGVIAGLPAVLATYSANYTAGDMPDLAADVIGHLGVNIITFAALIVLVWVAVMVMKAFGLKPKGRKV